MSAPERQPATHTWLRRVIQRCEEASARRLTGSTTLHWQDGQLVEIVTKDHERVSPPDVARAVGGL